jgi:uncharacterized protein (DUF952 family)
LSHVETFGMTAFVYKILRRSEWEAALSGGVFSGSADDTRDGFIHLSTLDQLAGTLRRHFAGEGALILLEIRTDALPSGLQWEASRGGALFPHLYADLPVHAVDRVLSITLTESGMHALPPDLAPP